MSLHAFFGECVELNTLAAEDFSDLAFGFHGVSGDFWCGIGVKLHPFETIFGDFGFNQFVYFGGSLTVQNVQLDWHDPVWFGRSDCGI